MNKDLHYIFDLITNSNGSIDYIVYEYIKKNNIYYINNTNGLFFNLNKLTNDQISEMKDILNVYLENLNKYNNKLNKIIDVVNNKIDNNGTNKIKKKIITNDLFNKYELYIIKKSKIK